MTILLLGASGQVGWELQRALAPQAKLIALEREDDAGLCGDLERHDELAATVRSLRPHVIVNAAAYTAVDLAETHRNAAWRVNASAPGVLAREAQALDALLVHYSTDYVFSGGGTEPWREDGPTGPLNVYGETKLEGERLIRASGCRHLIFRTSWVYAPRGRNFLRTMLRLAAERDTLSVVDDQHGAPTGAELIADVTAHALRGVAVRPSLAGTYHLAAGGETTWHGFAVQAIESARRLGLPVRVASDAICRCTAADFPTSARRPTNSRLSTSRIRECFHIVLPDWQVGVCRAVAELAAH